MSTGAFTVRRLKRDVPIVPTAEDGRMPHQNVRGQQEQYACGACECVCLQAKHPI